MDAKEIQFKSVSKTEWETKITKDLKGKELSSTSSITGTNTVIYPHHHADDNNKATHSFRQNKCWKMGFFANSNQEVLSGLQQGMNSIRLEQSNNLKITLKDVQLDIVNVFTPIKNSHDIENACDFIVNYPNHNISPFVVYTTDNLALTLQNTSMFSKLANSYSVQINSELQSNGVSSSNAIADLLLKLSSLLTENSNKEKLIISSKDIVFKWKIGTNFLEEIAAIRAMRICIANVLKAHKTDYSKIYIAAEPNEYFFANKDTANNILRESTMLSSAILGGANEVISVKYNTSDNQKETNRIAQNIQLILKEEAYMNEVIDPSKGSYYIEYITKEIADKSWSIFQELSTNSNLKEALNELADLAQKENSLLIKQYRTGEKTLLGENKFKNSIEKTPSNFNSIAHKIS